VSKHSTFPFRQYTHIRFWPAWFGLALLRVLVILPVRVQQLFGALLGRLLYLFMRERREVAEINIRLCFAEKDAAQQRALVKENFTSLGYSVFETAMSWWASDRRLAKLHSIDGLENLQEALSHGKGVILIGAHFMSLELGGRMLQPHQPIHVMYRPFNNPLYNALTKHYRTKHFDTAVDRDDIRNLLKSLKANMPVWYAPDQDYGGQHSEFVKFFGTQTAAISATARLAKMSGAKVVHFFHQRLHNGKFRLRCLPALENFPTDDVQQDTQRLATILENEISAYPEQYLWIHRRFKTRPPGMPYLYPRKYRIKRVNRDTYEMMYQNSKQFAGNAKIDRLRITANNNIVKIFRPRKVFSSSTLFPPANRFFKNSIRLKKLGIDAVDVKRVYYYKMKQEHYAIYPLIEGEELRNVLRNTDRLDVELQMLADYLAMLHQKGVFFRAMQLGNILVDKNRNFVLIDYSDMRFSKRPLGLIKRVRNMHQLLRHRKDREFFSSIDVDAFVDMYCHSAKFDIVKTERFKKLLKLLVRNKLS